jgi:hypothetical protein
MTYVCFIIKWCLFVKTEEIRGLLVLPGLGEIFNTVISRTQDQYHRSLTAVYCTATHAAIWLCLQAPSPIACAMCTTVVYKL